MLGEDLAVALCQVDFLEVVVADLVNLVEGLVSLEEDWVCALVVLAIDLVGLVVLGDYGVIDLVDLVEWVLIFLLIYGYYRLYYHSWFQRNASL